MTERVSAYALLALGVLSVGAAAILVRLAAAPALAVSWWRTLIGGLTLMLIVVVLRRPLPRGPELRRAIMAGVLLAAHFWLWIASLDHTSVAASVVLVCLQPVFVALLAFAFLRERTSLVAAMGIAVALGGALLILVDGSDALSFEGAKGDALALAGSLAIALYVLVGRKTAGKVDVLAFSATVSLVAAAALTVPMALAAPALRVPPTSLSWLWVIVLALGPQLVGHTALNAALARLPATVVSGAILGEPIIATALAWAFLAEVPGTFTLAGSVVVLGGLALLLRGAPVVPAAAPSDLP